MLLLQLEMMAKNKIYAAKPERNNPLKDEHRLQWDYR